MATFNVSTTWTSKLRSMMFLDNGDFQVTFVFLDSASVVVRSHTYLLKADTTGVYDETGFQVAATTPASLLTDAGNLATHFDTVMANAIAAGKVKP